MKKSFKIILIIVVVLLCIILIDTIQAKLFNNAPLIKVRINTNGKVVDCLDKGIFVYTYNFTDETKHTVFRWEKYSPPESIATSLQDENEKLITWEEITKDGVNEGLLIKNIDTELLTQIATEFQSLVNEEEKEERENPEIVITEGWTRIFDKERYKKVLEIGAPAMKPLYYILYKSKNNGQYEYLCAKALQEISGIGGEISEEGTMQWSTAKDYLDLFTKKVINQ